MTEPSSAVPRFRDALRRGFVATAALDPPRGTHLAASLQEASVLKCSVAAVNVSDSPMADLRMSPVALACRIREAVGIDTVFHLACRDRSLLWLQAELLGAWALGTENIIALTGDRQEGGDHPRSRGSGDCASHGLVRLASTLNEGRDAMGRELTGGTDFFIGAVSNPVSADQAAEIARLRSAVEAGARFTQTRPVYRWRDAEPFLGEASALGVPVIVGLLPIRSHRMLRHLDRNVPGITVPDDIRDRLEKTPATGVLRESVLLSRELIEELRKKAAGVHIMPLGDASLVAELMGGGDAPAGAPSLEEALRSASAAGRISCRSAFRVAAEQGVPPSEAGAVLEGRKIKIVACQLGCFR